VFGEEACKITRILCMDENIPVHPLENFPREDLYPGLTRRQFFQTMAVEFELFARQAEGSNAVKIPSLGSLPDNELYDLIPRILNGCEITLQDGKIWAKLPEKAKPICLFENERIILFVFNLINGKNSLKEIAFELAISSSLPFERAFALTRGLFLTLVKAGVCLPINNPFLG
jgi:hypothetical protein